MTLGHETLDVYRRSIGYVARFFGKAHNLSGVHRPAWVYGRLRNLWI